MANTKIEWSEMVWNPVTGCTKVSQGCKNCYAERLAPKVFAGQRVQQHIKDGLGSAYTDRPRVFTDVICHPKRLDAPLHWKKPCRIFVNSMSDLFHEDVPDEFIDRVFAVMALCPQHTFQVLTKRPERMREYCNDADTPFRVARAIAAITGSQSGPEELRPINGFPEQGHLRVPLFRDGGPRRGERMLVHRLVLSAFEGPPPSDDAQGRHLDGNPANNAISNLTWGGQSANWEDSKRHGSFRRNAKLTEAQVSEIRLRGSNGESAYSIAKYFPVSDTQIRNILNGEQWAVEAPLAWPLPNVWKGVSAEDQATADERIPLLLQTPAAVRFLSCEPLLGPIDLQRIKVPPDGSLQLCPGGKPPARIDWVIAGGESGPKARPSHPDWFRSLRDQCAAAGVPYFFKQWPFQVAVATERAAAATAPRNSP